MEVIALTADRGFDMWMEKPAPKTYPSEIRGSQKGFAMPYQHSLPPRSHSGNVAIGSPGFTPEYNLPAPGHMSRQAGVASTAPKTLRERKEAISQASQKLKRSVSTSDASMSRPNASEQAQLALGDKRRNKLGYHRTSVACGHCRRRKIRCIPEVSDPQGRCANCIRLKKECSFHPIDQPPTSEGRSKASSRASTGPKVGSASSSPTPASALLSSAAQTNSQYPGLAMPAAQHMLPHPNEGEVGSDNFVPNPKDYSNTGLASRPFDFASQPVMNWAAPDASPASTTKSLDLNLPWKSYPNHDSPMTPSFSPYTPNAPLPSANWSTPASEAGQREDVAWGGYAPAHPRSIPYDSEGRDSPKYPGVPSKNRQLDMRPADMPPDGYTSAGAVSLPPSVGMPMASLHQSVPLAAPTVPSNDYGVWNQQQQFQYGRPGPGGVAGWAYGGQPTHLGMQPDNQLPVTTSEPMHQAGMYYSGR